MEALNTLWVEKYRPRTLDDILLPDDYRADFNKYLQTGDIPNLLFYGPPGGGKTTVSLIIASREGIIKNPQDNILKLNGSAKSTRGIAFVDEVVIPFLKLPAAGMDKYRIVFIDEADYLTDQSIHALRGTIETFSNHGRFIFTCNYFSKIPDAIQSRFTSYNFKQVPIDFVNTFCAKILTAENVSFNKNDIEYIVNSLYPDIRKIINFLQKCSVSGKMVLNKDITLSAEKTVMSCLVEIIDALNKNENHRINKGVTTIIDTLDKYDIDYRSTYLNLFYNDKLPMTAKIIINKYTRDHGNCLVPSMHFVAMVYEIIKVANQYKSAAGGK